MRLSERIRSEDRQAVLKDEMERVFDLRRYRKTTMALKRVRWELERLLQKPARNVAT